MAEPSRTGVELAGAFDRAQAGHDQRPADRDAPLAVAITRSIVLNGLRAIEASDWVGLAEAG